MIWLFVVLSALVAFVVAAVSVGSVVADQSSKARPAVYDLNAAVDHVADRLPAEMTAVMTFDDVRQVQSRFFRRAMDQYGAEAGRIMQLGTDVVAKSLDRRQG